ncbi:hypothetical protein [Yinghuangia seranimata]|uniref:hypothetical protein n=1 Tax=Yinghuangia seranimata TaxID=408067 RepID=UPI00248AEA62|nr:hypothetical protein [Yinghuangia seranimata]MDI2131925.1 hypothetical protein [Yinghuangia seranimata]
MRTVRAFIRRVPAGPVVIALLMIGVLTLVNLYGSQGAVEHAAPSEPVGIPPQLPAEEHALPGPAATSEAPVEVSPVAPTDLPVPPASPKAGGAPSTTRPAPSATPGQSGGQPAPPVAPPQTKQQNEGNQGQQGSDGGDNGGSGPRVKVVGVVLTSDHNQGAWVRCDGRDEVIIAATILVDGGEGDVVYQWYFDNKRSWPPDLLHFTGNGQRQQSLQIPWTVDSHYSGTRVRGQVQLRILQPVVNAQTQRITIDVTCV